MRYRTLFSCLLIFCTPVFGMIKKQKVSPPPAEACCEENRWTGFTVGVNAGGLVNVSEGKVKPIGDFKLPSNVNDNPQRSDSFDLHGGAFITGAQLGYNYQMKVLVLGFETDFNYSMLNQKHEKTKVLTGDLSGVFHDKMTQLFNWFGTARGRFGYAFNKAPVLIFGTGGFAYGNVHSKTSVNFSATGAQYKGSASDWKIGWTAGGGVEWGFTRHWSMKAEYLYLQLREHHYDDGNVPLPSLPTYRYRSELETNEHIIRLGFNYTI